MDKVEQALEVKLSAAELEAELENDDFTNELAKSCIDELIIEKALALVPDVKPVRKVKSVKTKKRKRSSVKQFLILAAAAGLVFCFLQMKNFLYPATGTADREIAVIRDGRSVSIGTGEELISGDIIKSSAETVLTLIDGSTVSLVPGSELQLSYTDHFQLSLLKGRITAVVEKQDIPMQIACGETSAAVLGTQLAISRVDEHALLSVSEGRVKWSRGQESLILSKGEKSLSTPGRKMEKEAGSFQQYRILQLENQAFTAPAVHYIEGLPKSAKKFPGSDNTESGRWSKKSLSFAGKLNNRFEIPWVKGLNNEEFTCGVWFKTNQTKGHRQMILAQRTVILREPKGGGRGWSFLTGTNGGLEFWYGSKDLYWQHFSTPVLAKGKWYFAVVTVQKKGSDSEIIFYVNGREVERHRAVYTPVDIKSNRLHIGGSSAQLQLSRQMEKDHMEFEGEIDEFFILPSIPPAEDIKNLYEAGIDIK